MSTSNVITLVPKEPERKIASDASAKLREIADKIDTGVIDEIVFAWVEDDNYQCGRVNSLTDSLVLCEIYKDWLMNQFKGG